MNENEVDDHVCGPSVLEFCLGKGLAGEPLGTCLLAHPSCRDQQGESNGAHEAVEGLGDEVRPWVPVGVPTFDGSSDKRDENDGAGGDQEALSVALMTSQIDRPLLAFEFVGFFSPRILPPQPNHQPARQQRVEQKDSEDNTFHGDSYDVKGLWLKDSAMPLRFAIQRHRCIERSLVVGGNRGMNAWMR